MSEKSANPNAKIVAPGVRDLGALALTLSGWLAARMPEARDIHVSELSYPLGAGMSHETILFDADWRESTGTRRQGMVVRIKPMRDTVYPDDLFDQQYRLIQLMHESGEVRVARPLWFEADAAILGAPFFVMEKVAGRVAVSFPPYSREGWLFDSSPADRRRIWEDAVGQLAAIQKVPVAMAPFLALPGGPDLFEQEVDRWRRYLAWVDPSGAHVLLRTTFERMLAAGPANRVDGIVWGDSRLGNMIIGDDCKVTAVVDWEQPSLGGALHDLGWWLWTDHNQTAGQGIAPLAGMGSRAETIALWSEICGKPATDIEWYEAFACFKMECLAIRMMTIRGMQLRAEPGTGTSRLLDRLS